MSRRRKPSPHSGRYLSLTHWLMRTAAWRDLDCVARCAYLEIASRYAGPGSNNGRIPYSYREMADALNVSKSTAHRAIRSLQSHGFIVEVKRGAFSFKVRHATEWRLTEHVCDLTGQLPTKEFARWENQNPVRPEHPTGYRDETARVS